MMISTKGRYALKVLCDLAENGDGTYIPLKDIATRQELSLKYLESIMSTLSKGALVEGVHGKGGGYRLTKAPEKYTVGEVLRLTEVSLAPVTCVGENGCTCENSGSCKTLPMWIRLDNIINEYLDGVSIYDLINSNV